MTMEFPRKFDEADHDWNVVGNTATSGQTATSSVDVRSDGGGFWSASLNNIRFIDETYTLLWRAIRQICNGGVVPIIVYRKDILFIPFPGGNDGEDGGIPHSDGTLHDDGTGYYQPIIEVSADGAAARRATAMNIEMTYCGQLRGGECFSIEHPTFDWRLYEIGTVTLIDATHATITFNPPLREAVPDGTRLEFDRPRCLMKLASSSAMNLNTTTYPFSLATLKFVESKYG